MNQEQYEGLEPAKSSGEELPSPDINHELRTFLNTIIGYIELLQEDVGSQDKQTLAPDLEKILLASNHLAALVEEKFPDTATALTNTSVEPTSLSRESAGQWLRNRILAPSQQQPE